MLKSRTFRLLQVALLLGAGMWWIGCSGLPGGGGGGIQPTPKFISGTFKSDQGKVFSFADDGSYQFFPNAEKQASKEPDLASKYEVLDQDIVFERADGSKFSEPAKLSADGNSFTWAEYPGETFNKEQ